jgi:E3 ubiquitin-protein ligase SHPRH
MAESLTALGLDASGIPLSPQWELDLALLRTSIRRLRQACTHPQVGTALGGIKATAPRINSIDQVLACMVEGNMRHLWELRRALVSRSCIESRF